MRSRFGNCELDAGVDVFVLIVVVIVASFRNADNNNEMEASVLSPISRCNWSALTILLSKICSILQWDSSPFDQCALEQARMTADFLSRYL